MVNRMVEIRQTGTTNEPVKQEQDGEQDGGNEQKRDSNGQFLLGAKGNPEGKGGFGDNSQNINMDG